MKKQTKEEAPLPQITKVSMNAIVERETEMDELVNHRNQCRLWLKEAERLIAVKKAFYKKELEKN